MNRNSWSDERAEIAVWLSGYLSMVKKWVDKILDNEDVEVPSGEVALPEVDIEETDAFPPEED